MYSESSSPSHRSPGGSFGMGRGLGDEELKREKGNKRINYSQKTCKCEVAGTQTTTRT